LFADPGVKQAFAQAVSTSESLDLALRVRLFIGASAPELNNLRWETLRDPETGELLLTRERLLFSRYLGSMDWRPVRLQSQAQLRALVAIASPSNLADYSPGGQTLAPFDIEAELQRARGGLGDMPITELSTTGQVTLTAVASHLREGFDILYLVAHGALVQGEPYLWMEDASGQAAVLPGNDLVTRIRELPRAPRLVVLASCQSAGQGHDLAESRNEALVALGPRLAEAGVPAVLSMQGNVSIATLERFMPVFFHELQRDGLIDRAMAVARGTVRDTNDWWMPVLFMRLRSGRIWYVPGFGEDGDDFEKWPALIRNIQRGNCTPIIGQRMTETLLDPLGELARRWADVYRFPLAPHQREDLPQVAQFLAVSQDPQFPREELLEQLRRDILDRHQDDLPTNAAQMSLDELFAKLGAHYHERSPSYPYRALAEMPFKVYLTANLSNLLTEALVAVGKDPQVEICRWHNSLEDLPSIYETEPDYQPSVERPLVYHLFGNSQEPDSLVVTEDDYFDYLIGISINRDMIPIAVREALADTGLLFLGFKIDDWAFRVLFRSLMSQEGRGRRRRYAHVAAQITPEEGRILEPERARRYMEDYFQDSAIDIFWGSVEDFMRQLLLQWQSRAGTERRTRR
ncbi:MAG: CHAT domain-containing protein, partial [Chloroflexaceae bacterium]|nr:CHAT domain-containing protein [Chloroflexaceae bacterium]